MTYATRADLEDRFGPDEIGQRESMLPVGAVDRALADADAEIDGYLAGRYAVPMLPVPAHVLRVAVVIARYNLLGDAASERARNDYQDARTWLRDVQSGRVRLEGAATAGATAQQATITVVTGRDKAFAGGVQ